MTYQEWLSHYDRVSNLHTSAWTQPGLRPLISILVPCFNPDHTFLQEAIASVREQTYPHWEICLADDASTTPQTRSFLDELTESDQRIRLTARETNGHISACSNSALTLATGDWCALLDQDDRLGADALAEVAAEIARWPDAGIVYSDEDFLDSLGQRQNPFFKPEWNPDLFLSQNYLNHLGVYRTALLREIGGFREGFEGSQDYDLALRCVARLKPEQIRHIPRLLYRWRMVEGSLADQPDAKPYAREAARRALNDFLNEKSIAAQAVACPVNPESHRIVYRFPQPAPGLTIIIGFKNNDWLQKSSDGLEATVLQAEFSAEARNAAAASATNEILLFLSDETTSAETGWLREMISTVVRPEVGAVGARLWSPAGALEDGGLLLGVNGVAAPAFRGLPRSHPGYFNRAWLQQNFSAVSGACLMVRREIFARLGGFDSANLPHHFFDIDFCLRLREAGFRVAWTPYANLTFTGSGERVATQSPNEAEYLRSRWREVLGNDPCYNPNLSLEPPGFYLAIPPRT